MKTSKTPSVRVGITNASLSNAGDAAICMGIVSSIRRELGANAVDFVVFDGAAATSSHLYPEYRVRQQLSQLRYAEGWRFRIRQLGWNAFLCVLSKSRLLLKVARGMRWSIFTRLSSGLKELEKCDLVVSSGGTYLVDSYDFMHRVAELRIASALGKPVILWTQSLGPFDSIRARLYVRALTGSIAAAYVRDVRSLNAWQRSGGRVPAKLAADAAFALHEEDALGATDNERAAEEQRALVSVRRWTRGVETICFDQGAYRAMMRRGVEHMIVNGIPVVAVSTCQGNTSYAFDDSMLASEMFVGLDVDVVHEFQRPDVLLRRLRNSRLVITTRLHLGILALVVGVPVIAVAYEFKTTELFRSLGMAKHVIAIEDASPEWMVSQIEEAMSHPSSFSLQPEMLRRLALEARSPARDLAQRLEPLLKARAAACE